MHLYVNRQWTQAYGILLDETQEVGTVKLLDAYHVVQEKNMPDWVLPKIPKIWNLKNRSAKGTSIKSQDDQEKCINTKVSTNEQ